MSYETKASVRRLLLILSKAIMLRKVNALTVSLFGSGFILALASIDIPLLHSLIDVRERGAMCQRLRQLEPVMDEPILITVGR